MQNRHRSCGTARATRRDQTLGRLLDGLQNTQLLAQIAYDNGGALIQALAPGCGKTTLIETFTQLLKNNGLQNKKDYFVMSVTHVAAALADGSTIAHFRFKGQRRQNIWMIIDECSFNSAHMWNWLSKFKMVGAKFLILGDFPDSYCLFRQALMALITQRLPTQTLCTTSATGCVSN